MLDSLSWSFTILSFLANYTKIIFADGEYSIYEESENTTGVIRSRQSKKDKQYNGHKKKDKGTTTI
jgi:hypothetical protein